MRQTSELYKQLRTQTGSYYEVKIVRGDVTYGMDKLKSITIEQAMFDGNGPQIGGVYSSQCTVKLRERSINWPRAAAFEILVRLSSEDGLQKSEWLSFGTYYTDERKADKYGNLTLIAFDGMLRYEQPWTDKVQNLPASWPVTARKACDMLSEALGIEFDERTLLDNDIAFIGLDTTSTARETLATIAAGLGGNWHVTPDGKLYLVNLKNISLGIPAIAGIAVAGISIVGSVSPHDSASGSTINLGMAVKSVDEWAETTEVTSVELETSLGTIARREYGTGYTLRGKCDFSNSDVAGLCISRTYGYNYRPFEAKGARLDPAAEIGDDVIIADVRYQICTIKWNIGPRITADISAPYEEVVDHEYTMPSQSAKTLRKSMGYTDGQIMQTRSYIEQTERTITAGVAASYVNNQALNEALSDYSPTAQIEKNYYNKNESDSQAQALSSEIQLTDSRLQIAMSELTTDVNDAINAMTYYIRYENGVVIVGKSDSPTSIRISNEQIALYYNEEMLSYWNQNKQYTPKELQIPTGGKFTLGSILFQPRSSGNMSLLWVGQ